MKNFARWVVLYYLRFWAQVALFIHRPTIIGIAGSVGKSSTKEAIFAILKDYSSTQVTHGNSETGVPLGILGMQIESYSPLSWLYILGQCPFRIFNLLRTTYLVIEMGTDGPNPPQNMEYLLSIVKPDIALMLNTFPIHTEQFSTVLAQVDPASLSSWSEDQKRDYILEALAREDSKIITQSGCRVGIYNKDNDLVDQQISEFLAKEPLANLLSFGQDTKNTISYANFQVSPTQTAFEFNYQNQSLPTTFPGYVLPREYREVFAAAILAALQTGLNLDQISQSLQKNFRLPKSRASVLPGINGSLIIDSSYNAATAPMVTFLDLLAELKRQNNRPTVLLWGDMRELGPEAEAEHLTVANHLGGIVDQLICVGTLTKQFVMPLIESHSVNVAQSHWFTTSLEAGTYLAQNMPANALVLVKGSQNTIFLEEAIKKILAAPEDSTKLCRQEPGWLARKQRFFASAIHSHLEAAAIADQATSPATPATLSDNPTNQSNS